MSEPVVGRSKPAALNARTGQSSHSQLPQCIVKLAPRQLPALHLLTSAWQFSLGRPEPNWTVLSDKIQIHNPIVEHFETHQALRICQELRKAKQGADQGQ